MKKIMIATLILCLAVPSFAWAEGGAIMENYGKINIEELEQKKAEKADFYLLDVRQPDEYKTSHIEGATLIPLGELAARLGEIPSDKSIIVYCRSGRRSAVAADILVKNGFKDVKNLEGGMMAWTIARAE